MPSELLNKTFILLQFLSNLNSRKRAIVLKQLADNSDIFDSLSEICTNIINGNITIAKKDKIKLRKYAELIEQISTKPKSSVKRRKLIIQTGGFFPNVIPHISKFFYNAAIEENKKK